VNFSKKLHNADDAARPATLRDDGRSVRIRFVDFSQPAGPSRSQEKRFPEHRDPARSAMRLQPL